MTARPIVIGEKERNTLSRLKKNKDKSRCMFATGVWAISGC